MLSSFSFLKSIFFYKNLSLRRNQTFKNEKKNSISFLNNFWNIHSSTYWFSSSHCIIFIIMFCCCMLDCTIRTAQWLNYNDFVANLKMRKRCWNESNLNEILIIKEKCKQREHTFILNSLFSFKFIQNESILFFFFIHLVIKLSLQTQFSFSHFLNSLDNAWKFTNNNKNKC